MKKNLLVLLSVLSLIAPMARGATFTLGSTSLIEGPAAGSDSVVLAAGLSWTASTNAAWLHLNAGYQSGAGSTNIIFSFDANIGPTRTGTFTIAGQTLTITQAGSAYVTINPVSNLVSAGLSSPEGMAVDAAGNVYIVDNGNKAIKKWTATNNTVTTLVISNATTRLASPAGLALDSAGNVYIADGGTNAIKKWTISNGTLSTLVSSNATTPLSLPTGVAVDSAGNVYIADSGNSAIKKWTAVGGALTTLVSSGLNSPTGVAVDAAGNIYIADFQNSAIKKWTAANSTVTTLVSTGLNGPEGLAVDGTGNIYIADTFNSAIKVWTLASNTLTTLIPTGTLSNATSVAVDGGGNVYLSDFGHNLVKERFRVLVDPTVKNEGPVGGSDTLPTILPATQNLLPPFAPSSDSAWLTISGVTNGMVTFAFTANTNALATNRTGHIILLGQSISVIQAMPTYSLGTTNLLEGPTASSDSVMLAANFSWTASTNATWLHLSAKNQSGATSTNVIFSFDANTGATRTGTLTIGGQTVTVTQAGSNYVAVTSLITVVSSVIVSPEGVAVDNGGNVFISDANNQEIYKWTKTNNSIAVFTDAPGPFGMVLDRTTNLYAATAGFFTGDTNNSTIKKVSANGVVSSVVSSGLNGPRDVAVNSAGDLYIADTLNNVVKKWTAASGAVTTFLSSGTGNCPGVGVDLIDNVYFIDRANNAINKWTAANSNVVTLVSSGLNAPSNVRVDGSGNVFFCDRNNNSVKKWIAANSNVVAIASSGLSVPFGVSVDAAGNVYIADSGHSALKELPAAMVDSTAKYETSAGGGDALSVVLPSSINLSGPFAPTSDAAWLTISGVTNGVVSFAFTANTLVANRTAHITLLGQNISVTQYGVGQLGVANLLEGPGNGSDSVLLVGDFPWTATTNAAWLHLSTANQSGANSTNVIFSFDANTGATRTGTLTIANYTLTVTQAGSSYVLANPVVPLVFTTPNNPPGTTVDGAGNVYFADFSNYSIKKWSAANNTVTTLVSSGLNAPEGIAVDSAGNVFIADSGHNAIKKWSVTNSAVTALVTNGLNFPFSVALDSLDNVYIADYGNNAVKKWSAADSNVTTLVSNLNSPKGVALDVAGNVYIADYANLAMKKWMAANSNVITLDLGDLEPKSVVVDGGGNIYINDDFNVLITKWSAASNSLSTVFPYDTTQIIGLGLDGAGNIYFGNSGAVNEQLRAFVDPSTRSVTTNSGSGSLPAVLPLTANLTGPFVPTSDAAWLTISGVNNGVVSYAYARNTNAVRTAHINLLGQSIAITQSGAVSVTPPVIAGLQITGDGAFSFIFTNNQNAAFTIWTSTNVAFPLTNWTVLGTATNNGSGLYQFSDPQTTNSKARFYRVTSP